MKAKVLFSLTIAVLSLSAITLLSCSKDEDDSIHSGNTNLVGTWAEIDSPFDGKQDGFFVYFIKADCSISVLGYHSYKYDDGYLIDPYYTQQEVEKRIATGNTYHCSFSNNIFLLGR